MIAELSTLLRDEQFWKKAGISSLPGPVVGFLLGNQGKPDALLAGIYIWFFFVGLTVSWHIITARIKASSGIITGPGKDKPEEKEIYQYPILRRFAIIFSTLILLSPFVLSFVPSFNASARRLIYGAPTAIHTQAPISITIIDPIQNPAQTPTTPPTLPFTKTPRATATTSVSKSIYYMIVLDASKSMDEEFDNRRKWDVAIDSVTSILEGLDPDANYGLVAIGGSESASSGNQCEEPALVNTRFSSLQKVKDRIADLRPAGGGSYYQAFILAKNEFKGLPPNTIRSIIYITGSRDDCEKRDEWKEFDTLFQIPGAIDAEIYSEIIIIDQEKGVDTETIADQIAARINSLSNKVNAQAPQTVIQLQQTNETVVNNVTIHVNSEVQALSTVLPEVEIPTPIQPTKTSTLVETPTRVVIIPTLPIPTITPFIPPTATSTNTLTPVPTLGAHTWVILPPQTDVFSTDCPLVGNARLYAQFYNNLAGINAQLIPSQKTGNGLSIDFTNTSAEAGNYAGWEVWMGSGDQNGINLSSYGSLSFYIRGNIGNEQPNVYLMNPVTNEGYRRSWKDIEQIKPISTSWQQIVIPLSHFASSQDPNQQVDLTNVQRIQIVFEWYPQSTSGRVYIDDLCVVP